jgi:hypothetical protein
MTSPRFALSLLLGTIALAACQDSPTMAPPPTASSRATNGTGSRGGTNTTTGSQMSGGTMGSGGTTGVSGTTTGGLGTTTGAAATTGGDVPAQPLVEPEKPALTFNGTGFTKCEDQNLRTDTQVLSKLTNTELTIERLNVHVQCYESGFFASAFGHACDDAEFNAQIMAGAKGVTTYNRFTNEDAKATGGKVPIWAIMAKSVRNTRGEVYVFDKPIPVFPLPGAVSRYKELDQPQVFNANVSGPTNASVQMTVTKTGVEGDVVKLHFALVLNGNPSDPALYDKFPIPHEADFDVRTANVDLRGMHTLDLFVDDKGCENGGRVEIDYQLCRKQTSTNVEDTHMPYCQ